MSHSYDSTLLQRMGFNDPDRRSPDHDRACIELATNPEQILSRKQRVRISHVEARLEQPLQKGDGKYASTVGFIDVVIEFTEAIVDYQWHQNAHFLRAHELTPDGPAPLLGQPACAVVEVKTSIGTSVGDLLRQLNLYREYYRPRYAIRPEFIIWSLDPDDAPHIGLLAKQGYQLVVGRDLEAATAPPSLTERIKIGLARARETSDHEKARVLTQLAIALRNGDSGTVDVLQRSLGEGW